MSKMFLSPVTSRFFRLLWRLQLRDIEIGSRWQVLADHWEKQTTRRAWVATPVIGRCYSRVCAFLA